MISSDEGRGSQCKPSKGGGWQLCDQGRLTSAEWPKIVCKWRRKIDGRDRAVGRG